jgi:excisionase family DNA binding protein
MSNHETKAAPGMEPILLSAEQVATMLGVNRSTVFDLLRRGDLASVRIGRRRLISRSAITDFVERHERAADS